MQSYISTKAQVKNPALPAGPLDLHVIFYPGSNRKRDLDNLIAAIKPGIDGMADALQINDNRFHVLHAQLGEAQQIARVEIRLEPTEYQANA